MKKVITVANLKGGTGKSTVALNLAIELSKKHAVSILDLDAQKSATIFNRLREGEGLEPLEMHTAQSEKEIKKIITDNKGLLIIDSGAQDSDINRFVICHADFIICPVSDAEIEIYGLLTFNELLKTFKKANRKLKAHVLMNRLPAKATGADIADQVKKNPGTLALMKTIIRERKEYKHLFARGKGATEATRKTAAADEIKALVKEVLK